MVSSNIILPPNRPNSLGRILDSAPNIIICIRVRASNQYRAVREDRGSRVVHSCDCAVAQAIAGPTRASGCGGVVDNGLLNGLVGVGLSDSPADVAVSGNSEVGTEENVVRNHRPWR